MADSNGHTKDFIDDSPEKKEVNITDPVAVKHEKENGNSTDLVHATLQEFEDRKVLSENIKHYHFFAAMRLLESINQSKFGYSKTPNEDPIFLGQNPHINFATSMLHGYRKSIKTQHEWIDVNFFGLLGPNGPMPLHMSEEITRLKAAPKQQITDFFNLFHHRLLSLFYRAWANKEPELYAESNNKNNNYERYIGSLAGIGLKPLKNNDAMPDYGKLGHVAFLGGYSRHKQGLEAILFQLYNLKATIREFTGEWMAIPKEFQCQLRESHYAKQLGKNSTLGKNSWQCQYKFQLNLGPLTYEEYLTCLPGTHKLRQINETIKNYVGLEFDWEIILLFKKTSQPRTRLARSGLLGWTTWLSSSIDSVSNPTEKNAFVADLCLDRHSIEQRSVTT